MKIDVLVPVYNSLETVIPCLNSVFIEQEKAQELSGNMMVIDDCSDSYTSEKIQSLIETKQKAIYLKNEENLGFVKSCNRGLKNSDGDILVLLNSDTIITEGFFEKIRDCFLSDITIGIASPVSSASPHFCIPMLPGLSYLQMAKLVDKFSEKRYPEAVTPEGFCFCIKKEVIEQIGLLDEVFGMGYCEESDYTMRSFDNGFRCVCIDNLYVYHQRRASFGERRSDLYKKNRQIFDERWDSLYHKLYEKYMKPNPINYLKDRIEALKPEGSMAYLREDEYEFYAKIFSSSLKEKINAVIFGTGGFCKRMWTGLDFEKINMCGFFDNNSDIHGTFLFGYKISKPEYKENMKIIVASSWKHDIFNQLLELGYDERNIFII